MRETATVVITDGDQETNRDHGKRFIIKEMPAMIAEKWAWRMLLALAKAGVDVEMIKGSGMAGLAIAGIQALPNIDFDVAEPLMDEMLPYMHIVANAEHPLDWGHSRALHRTDDGEGDDVQELTTMVELRKSFMELHTRFFTKGAK